MEPKWVLTSSQKKIRFRNFLKKRKSGKVGDEKPQVNPSEDLGPISEEHNSDESPNAGSLNFYSSPLPLSDQNSFSRPVHNTPIPLNREITRKRLMEGNTNIFINNGLSIYLVLP